MAEIKEFKPKPFDPTRVKPEKPADVIDIETRKKIRTLKSESIGSALAGAIEHLMSGRLSDADIESLQLISRREKELLKIKLGLFKKIEAKEEVIDALRSLVKKLEDRLN